jgi:uncharacterized protein YeaO (DUF488 family)
MAPRPHQGARRRRFVGTARSPKYRIAKVVRSRSLQMEPIQTRYRKELQKKKDTLQTLKHKCRGQTVTLVYGARDEEHNEALVLKEILAGRKR